MHKPLRTVLSYIRKDQLPPDWSIASVGDVVSNAQYGMNTPSAHDGETQIVGMRDIRKGRVRFDNLARATVSDSELEAYRLRSGDLLINRTNSLDQVGKVGIVDADRDVVFASYLVRLIADRSKIDPEFLNLWLNSNIAQRTIKRIATPAIGQANINPTEFQKYCLVPLPPMAEQRRIAALLRAWDEAIEKLEALRAAKERFYNAFARMFFDPCHPTFQGRPNAWREFELGDVFCERKQSGEESERLLSITMNGGVIDREDVGRKDTSTEDKSNYKLILPGDIGYNTMRMWQGVSGLSALRGIISPAYTVVIPLANRVLGGYAAHLFKSRRMVFDFERYSQGLTSDTWNLKFPSFSKIRIFLPPVEDQEKQANLLDALIAESTLIGKQLETLTRQKRGLMQKLLTGEWRVPLSAGDVEKSAERTAEDITP